MGQEEVGCGQAGGFSLAFRIWLCIPPELCDMEPVNSTEVSEFFLKGFSGYPALEHLLFPLCSAMYLVTLLGNTGIVAVSLLDARLHTPMYFFLGNLSILDICYTSTFVPLMLVHLLSAQKTISFLGCALQMCLSLSTGSTECLLLAIMAYDRYLAICRPLRYPVLMSHRLCWLLAGGAWVLCLCKYHTTVRDALRDGEEKSRLEVAGGLGGACLWASTEWQDGPFPQQLENER
ncbi:hypothetical protein AB1E18_006699 [Capra hircus]